MNTKGRIVKVTLNLKNSLTFYWLVLNKAENALATQYFWSLIGIQPLFYPEIQFESDARWYNKILRSPLALRTRTI